MTFEEAVRLVSDNPAGPNAVAVTRGKRFQFMFATQPLPDGGKRLMGGWTSQGRNSETHAYVLDVEDVLATDWEVLTL